MGSNMTCVFFLVSLRSNLGDHPITRGWRHRTGSLVPLERTRDAFSASGPNIRKVVIKLCAWPLR